MRRTWMICVLLLVLTVGVFWPIRGFEFLDIDDDSYVRTNPQVQRGLERETIAWAFTTYKASNWHPVTWLSHLADVEMYGMDAGRHHLTSLWIHAANALLVFLVLRRLTGAVRPSAFVAAVFAVHPLALESVAWVAERKNVLSTFFWLLTLWAYARYVDRPNAARYAGVAALFAVGLMAKPMLVTVPLVLLLLDYWPLGMRGRSLRRVILEKIPLLVLSGLSSLLTVLAQHGGRSIMTSETFPLSVRLSNMVVSYVKYVWMMLYPVDLAFFYPLAAAPPPVWKVTGCAFMLILISALVFVFRGRRYLVTGWLWYVITLIPVIGLVQVGRQAMADRYMYVPQIGLSLMIVWALAELGAVFRRIRPALWVCACVSIAGLVTATRSQMGFWHDSFALYERAICVTADNHLAHHNLANLMLNRGRHDEAVEHYSAARRIAPAYYPDAAKNLSIALIRQGRTDRAIEFLRKELEKDPGNVGLIEMLGNAYLKAGDGRNAEAQYAAVLEIDPGRLEANVNLARLYKREGRLDEAIARLRRALETDSGHPAALSELGTALMRNGRYDEAARYLATAVELQPGSPTHHNNLGMALAGLDRTAEAIAQYQEALRLDSEYATAHYNLGNVFARDGRLKEAARHYSEAIRLKPDHADARANLDAVRGMRGK
ncbi:MAG: hypothetical protein A3G34_11170 [Candidatus Lindowbacteria bacterium RIFCSPLOWO2_12_FULL_62_27]|nr:MAG: hypothetical protein A3G34_11170 [Candidatus Lindowbacteria bacterium RIFCSPLOWO2_12_FULL_62_27]